MKDGVNSEMGEKSSAAAAAATSSSEQKQQQPESPTHCRNGCGFFSASATDGFCSLCYKDVVNKDVATSSSLAQKESPVAAAAPSSSNTLKSVESESTTVALGGDASGFSSSGSSAGGKVKRNRCFSCKKKGRWFTVPSPKKVGLTGFTCRCGGLFCPLHRYTDEHECHFDYRVLGAEEIRKDNPVVTASKVRKI